LISDPKQPQAVTVNLTTDDIDTDSCCIIKSGEHPYVAHDSAIA
jgi:hypothetical protein